MDGGGIYSTMVLVIELSALNLVASDGVPSQACRGMTSMAS